MKNLLIILALSLTAINNKDQFEIKCLIRTTLGEITLELYPQKAPVTVANFLYYVDHNLYNGTTFFRVCTPKNEADREIKIEVIQGGDLPEELCKEPIPLETTKTTTLSHLDGTISMARDTPHSATSSFFICIGDQPELDYGGKRNPDGQGFAAFGKVTDGMEVVKLIQQQKDTNQYLLTPVKILQIERIK